MNTLRALSSRLIEAEGESASEICADVFQLLRSHAPAAVNDTSLLTPFGTALAPSLAGNCLLDGSRTVFFLRAVLDAIREAEQRFPGEPIEIVYAGAGPFATLAILAIPLLDLARLRFTLIDVNDDAISSIRALTTHYGISLDAIRTDATTYEHRRSIHVVISETMQRSLAHEPFVAIYRNLQRQLVPGGIFVPDEVRLELWKLDAERTQAWWQGAAPEPVGEEAGTIFTTADLTELLSRTPRTMTVTCSSPARTTWLAVFTQIRTFRGEALSPYVSGLTVPEILWNVSPITRDVELEFVYELGTQPRLACRQWPLVR